MNPVFAAMSLGFATVTTIFIMILVHEYVHVLQLRPKKPSEFVLLGWKKTGWGGWVRGEFAPEAERGQESVAAIIDLIVMMAVLFPYMIMVLKEMGLI